jgi:hypothetical protein
MQRTLSFRDSEDQLAPKLYRVQDVQPPPCSRTSVSHWRSSSSVYTHRSYIHHETQYITLQASPLSTVASNRTETRHSENTLSTLVNRRTSTQQRPVQILALSRSAFRDLLQRTTSLRAPIRRRLVRWLRASNGRCSRHQLRQRAWFGRLTYLRHRRDASGEAVSGRAPCAGHSSRRGELGSHPRATSATAASGGLESRPQAACAKGVPRRGAQALKVW